MGVTLTANLSLRRPSVDFGELKGDFARLPQAIPLIRGRRDPLPRGFFFDHSRCYSFRAWSQGQGSLHEPEKPRIWSSPRRGFFARLVFTSSAMRFAFLAVLLGAMALVAGAALAFVLAEYLEPEPIAAHAPAP